MDLIKVVEMEPYGNRIPAYYSIGINLPQNRTARKTLTKGIPIYRKVLQMSKTNDWFLYKTQHLAEMS